MSNLTCSICNSNFEKQILLTNHIKKYHNMSYKDYYDIYIKSENEGICLTCGQQTKFERNQYRQFCSRSCMRRNSFIQDTIKNTCIKKYGGVGLGSKEIQQKTKNTNLLKYGVENPYMIEHNKIKSHSTEAKEKYRQTMLSKYNVDSPLKLECNKQKLIQAGHTKEIIEKRNNIIRQNNIEKYNVEYTTQRKDVIQSIKNSRIQRQINFCLENNCTSINDLINIYGNGWYQSGLEFKYLFDGNNKYILNSEIYKIEEYSNKHVKSCNEECIYQYIKNIYSGTIIQHTRKIIKPYELDIYLPEINLAIEYNGMYWHNANNVSENYHFNKTKLCEQKEIRLIHIFEDEWINHKDICNSIICSALNTYSKVILDKDCKIKEITTDMTNNFLSENDLLGPIENSSYIRLGLFYNNELVQVICIDNSNNNFIQIIRMCTKKYFKIENNYLKILNYLHYKELYYYADLTKFDKTQFNNFEVIKYIEYSYFYYNDKLERFYNENIDIQNYYKIYDCGKLLLRYGKN